jgi:hypothetical protein
MGNLGTSQFLTWMESMRNLGIELDGFSIIVLVFPVVSLFLLGIFHKEVNEDV